MSEERSARRSGAAVFITVVVVLVVGYIGSYYLLDLFYIDLLRPGSSVPAVRKEFVARFYQPVLQIDRRLRPKGIEFYLMPFADPAPRGIWDPGEEARP